MSVMLVAAIIALVVLVLALGGEWHARRMAIGTVVLILLAAVVAGVWFFLRST
jgi:hypothetical protein